MLESVAFSLGPIHVRWYGIILGTAALIGLLLAIQEGKRFKIIPDFFMDLLLIGVPSAIVGARIYYVAFQWSDYKNNLAEIFMIWHGGIAIYGALIGAIIGVYFYVRAKGYGFADCGYLRTWLNRWPSYWTLGQLHESGSARRSCFGVIPPRHVALAEFYCESNEY